MWDYVDVLKYKKNSYFFINYYLGSHHCTVAYKADY